MRIVWSLALAQLRRHRGRWALLTFGVALVVAVPVITSGLSRTVAAQTVRRTISHLDLTDRTLLVSQEVGSSYHKGTPAQDDAAVRRQLARLTAAPVTHELVFRQLVVQGAAFVMAGVDDLPQHVHLTSGRLPRTCVPSRCEVVQLGGVDPVTEQIASLGLVVVGTVTRTDPLLVSGALHPPADSALVLADGAAALGKVGALGSFSRYAAWAAAADADRAVALGVDSYLRRSKDVADELTAQIGLNSFQSPDEQLEAAHSRVEVSVRRFGLLGGLAAVLLLGFALVAAVGLRRESRLLQSVLRRRGALGSQVVLVHVLQAVVVAAAGAVAGLVLGGGIASAGSAATGLSPTAAAGHAVAAAALSAGLLAAAGAAIVVAVLLWPDEQARGVWRLLDVIAIACAGAALLAADRGHASASDLAANGDPLVVALPVLACVVAGLVAARLWAPATRLAARLQPRRAVAARAGLLGALRRPLRPVASAAFLTAAVAAVVFAGAYRTTLLAADADQAAFQVPLDATVSANLGERAPVLSLNEFGAGTRMHPVLRASASVIRLAGVTERVAVLGADPDAVRAMHRFARTTGSSRDAATVSDLLRTTPPSGPVLPAGTRTVTIDATGYDPQTTVTLWLRASSGHTIGVQLAGHGATLTGTVPEGDAPLTAVAFGVDESIDYATHHQHAIGEGDTDQPLLTGELVLRTVRADGSAVPWTWASWGSRLATIDAAGGVLRFGYRLAGSPVVAVPSLAARTRPVPVVVDPQTAATARDGTLTLRFDATTSVTARIVATMPRLPTTGDRFVLAGRAALTAAMDASAPTGNVGEYWVSGPVPSSTAYQVVRREAVQADLDADPIGRGARTLLILVAGLALAVGAVALVLLVVGERRDGAGELYVWEADGARPAVLRRVLAVRATAVAAIAVPVGVLAGLVLARVGATLVAVDAAGTTPTPPLQVTLGSAWTVLVLAAGIGAGLAGGGLVAARSLRERLPVPAEADLR